MESIIPFLTRKKGRKLSNCKYINSYLFIFCFILHLEFQVVEGYENVRDFAKLRLGKQHEEEKIAE